MARVRRLFHNIIVVPSQLIVGGLLLGIILCMLPLLYIALWLKYKSYVIQRERVIRGLQRKDGNALDDIEAQGDNVQRGSLESRKSQYMTRDSNVSARCFNDDSKLFSETRILSNYSGTYQVECIVRNVADEKDIVESINFARNHNLHIRAMGSLFSWPNIVEPSKSRNEEDGIVLDMKGYRQMTKLLIFPEEETQSDGTCALITVQVRGYIEEHPAANLSLN